jgi:hypothetical protein
VFCMDLKQREIISLYTVNRLVFITETECVYCAVRTGYLNVVQINYCLSRTEIPIMKLLKYLETQLYVYYEADGYMYVLWLQQVLARL